jgi:hypothetical protein
MASTRSGPAASAMRIGRSGTPSTSSASKPVRTRPCELAVLTIAVVIAVGYSLVRCIGLSALGETIDGTEGTKGTATVMPEYRAGGAA